MTTSNENSVVNDEYVHMISVNESMTMLHIPNKMKPDDPMIKKTRDFLSRSNVSQDFIKSFEEGLKNRLS